MQAKPAPPIRASDGRLIVDVPVDERLTAQLAHASAVVVPDFILERSTWGPDAATQRHDLTETFRSLADEGDVSIEPAPGGFRVVPRTGMGLYHVGRFLWGRARPTGGG